MAYAAINFLPFEVLTSTKMNQAAANDASFNDGTGLGASTVTRAKLVDGLVAQRQGGNSGDANWHSSGTTNVDTSAKRTIIQAGAKVAGSGTFTVTFPTPFAYSPIVTVTPRGSSGVYGSGSWYLVSETTTGFTFQSGSANNVSFTWIAVGQV